MFEALTDKLNNVFRNLSGRGKIDESNVREALDQVRRALLEADVNLEVARKFCDNCLQKALGQEVINSLHPGQVMVKICHDELVSLMGPVDTRIYYVQPGPTIILMAGLQGSGKTTTCAKLAKYILGQGRKPLMVACDLQRPAAIEQLKVLGEQIGVPVYLEEGEKNPVKVARNGVTAALKGGQSVVILDTAGRLHVDEEMMGQVADVAQTVKPHQIYLVCDAMTGQDAVNSAKVFNERLELDGVILTKFDSDARGGAALSVKEVTGKPIKFIGVGEKLDKIEEFHPDRMASRILGMGDIVTLVEKAQQQFDAKEMEKTQAKMAKGSFTLEDFLGQLRSMKKMGSMKDILKMIPGLGSQLPADIDDGEMHRMEAIILSMTKKERRNPDLIDGSRRRRIAKGSGAAPEDVSGLVKSFVQMRSMMKQMANLSFMDRMRLGSNLSKGALMTGKMPKISVQSSRLSSRDKLLKRRNRKKNR
ncbi:MAG: signal recognition particle protein [Phycisphaerae bacterium]|nr:signal recognition particle protein [Phycisphaerae bacterium]